MTQKYTDEEMFLSIVKVWMTVKHRPTYAEMIRYRDIAGISVGAIDRRFNGFSSAVMRTVYWAKENGIDILELDRAGRIPVEEQRSISPSLRLKVMWRDAGRCQISGCDRNYDNGDNMHVDHISPFSRGGKTELDNLHVLCEQHNRIKSDSLVEELGWSLKQRI